jgi:hypothetical protein
VFLEILLREFVSATYPHRHLISHFLARLSAYLFELKPQNATYLNIAQQATDFTLSHWFTPNSVISLDTLNGTSCTGANVFSNGPASWSTGTIIEGISVLANLTQNVTLTNVCVGFRSVDH